MQIAVCNTGLGNLRSVERALLTAAKGRSVEVALTSDPDAIARADKVVVPGQGAFGDCSRALAGGMGGAIREAIGRGTPYLGICLGLQILFGGSEEAPECPGLGLLDGHVAKLSNRDPASDVPLKVPHVGWNTAVPTAHRSLLPETPTYFYFVHSYAVRPRGEAIVAATTAYGEPFVSAVAKDNVFACQFHPEKSQRAGLELLARFLRV